MKKRIIGPKQPDPVDKHVGSRVRMRRMMLDMTQTDLADALGLTFQQVQKYEKGANRISSSKLQRMANILKVPIPFFFENQPGGKNFDGSGSPPAFVAEFLATKEGLALTKAFMNISDAVTRKLIVQLVQQVAS